MPLTETYSIFDPQTASGSPKTKILDEPTTENKQKTYKIIKNFSANKRLEHQKQIEEARRQSIGSQIVGKVYPQLLITLRN